MLASLLLAGCSASVDSAQSIRSRPAPEEFAASAAAQLAAPYVLAAIRDVRESTVPEKAQNGSVQSGARPALAPQPAFSQHCLPVTESPQGAFSCQPPQRTRLPGPTR